jgi:hypothetical protein
VNGSGLHASARLDADDSKASTIHFINNLTEHLTISSEHFLSDFCAIFYKIHNSDELENKIALVLDLFDVNKLKKRLEFLDTNEEDEMGSMKNSFFITTISLFLV